MTQRKCQNINKTKKGTHNQHETKTIRNRNGNEWKQIPHTTYTKHNQPQQNNAQQTQHTINTHKHTRKPTKYKT